MRALANALVSAVNYIAYRSYSEDDSTEALEDADIQALETIKSYLANLSDDERLALSEAIGEVALQYSDAEVAEEIQQDWRENFLGDHSLTD